MVGSCSVSLCVSASMQPASAIAVLPSQEARTYLYKLRRRRGVGTLWLSRFSRSSRRKRAALVRQNKLPVVTLHLAAQTIQAVLRGFQLRVLVANVAPTTSQGRVPLACRRAAAAAAEKRARRQGQSAVAAAVAEAAASSSRARSTELSLVSRYLEAKMRRSEGLAAFNDWILLRLQAWARMVPWRAYNRALRDLVLQTAALSLQRLWFTRQQRAGRPTGSRSGAHSTARCAVKLQRSWRGFTNRRIFSYLREMLLFREQVCM